MFLYVDSAWQWSKICSQNPTLSTAADNGTFGVLVHLPFIGVWTCKDTIVVPLCSNFVPLH